MEVQLLTLKHFTVRWALPRPAFLNLTEEKCSAHSGCIYQYNYNELNRQDMSGPTIVPIIATI